MFRLFECCALSFFERFVLSFSLKIERFVSDSAEIWICGLYSPDCLENFIQLDDNDIWTALKVWSNHSDVVLSTLSRGMINRKLFKVEVTSSSITKARKEEILLRISKQLNINKKEAKYFLSISSIENNMYKKEDDSIEIIYKDGSTRDIAKASDMLNISLLSRKVKKYYICYLRSENDGH